MRDQMQAMDDQQAEGAGGKRPYQTPKLTKLGNVRELTQGGSVLPVPDDGTFSI